MSDMSTTQAIGSTATQDRRHSLVASDRSEITVKGVSEVVSFDETLVRLVTACGILNLEGEGLRVRALDLKEGVASVTGRLNGLLYEEEEPVREPATKGRSRSRRFFG